MAERTTTALRSLLPPFDRTTRGVLVTLLAVDVVLVAVHLVLLFPRAGSSLAFNDFIALSPWSISADNGIPEVYGYVKVALLVLSLVLMAVTRRRPVLMAWAAVYALIVLDDALRLHEGLGRVLAAAPWFPDQVLGLRAQDAGEVTTWALIAVVPLAAVVLLHRRADPVARRQSTLVALLVAALVFCEVVLDQVHAIVGGMRRGALIGAAEDGGAMVVLSVSVVVVVAMWRHLPPRQRVADQEPARTETVQGTARPRV